MSRGIGRIAGFGLLVGLMATAQAARIDVTAPGDTIVGLHATVAGGLNTYSTSGTGPGQYPSNEAPPNAINNTLAKYLNFGNTGSIPAGYQTGFYVTPASGPSVVTGIRLQTANDNAPRDPVTFTLEGTNGDPTQPGVWTLIAQGNTGLQTDPGRNTWQPYGTEAVFNNTAAYTSYRLLFPTVRGTGQNSMQVAEAELLRYTGTLSAAIAMESRTHAAPDNLGTGAIVGNPFSSINGLSSTDYADASQGNGVAFSVVLGSLHASSGSLARLNDGLWPSSADASGENVFSDTLPFRILVGLADLIPVYEVNTFSRHTGGRTPQSYMLFGSDLATPPSATGDLESNGWSLIAMVSTSADDIPVGTLLSLSGVAGVSIHNQDLSSLGDFRHLIFDFRMVSAGTFLSEIDIYNTPSQAIPEPATCLLLGTGLAALCRLRSRRRRSQCP